MEGEKDVQSDRRFAAQGQAIGPFFLMSSSASDAFDIEPHFHGMIECL